MAAETIRKAGESIAPTGMTVAGGGLDTRFGSAAIVMAALHAGLQPVTIACVLSTVRFANKQIASATKTIAKRLDPIAESPVADGSESGLLNPERSR